MLYIYLHGFNSGYDSENPKVKVLSSIGEVIGINYNSFATYEEIFEQISHEVSSQVHDFDSVVFVGTSLGGFWAAEMGIHFEAPSVIINPCHDPYNMLRKYVGITFTNYVSGVTDCLTNQAVESYPTSGLAGKDRKIFAFFPLVLLDMGDEVIDSSETLKVLKGFPTIFWQDGSHRFEHMDQALTYIRHYSNTCSVTEDMNF